MRKPNDECSICQTPIYRRPADKIKYESGYCPDCKSLRYSESAQLAADNRYQNYIHRWLLNEESGMRGKTGISGHIRRYLIEQKGSRCWKCDWSEINPVANKVPIEISHVDGDFTNNHETNLELLCPNCHSLTPSYRSLNNGRGRPR